MVSIFVRRCCVSTLPHAIYGCNLNRFISTQALFEEIQSSFAHARKVQQTKRKHKKYQNIMNTNNNQQKKKKTNKDLTVSYNIKEDDKNSIFSKFNSDNYPLLSTAMEDSYVEKLESNEKWLNNNSFQTNNKKNSIQRFHEKQRKPKYIHLYSNSNFKKEEESVMKDIEFYDLPIKELITKENIFNNNNKSSLIKKKRNKISLENNSNNNFFINDNHKNLLKLLNDEKENKVETEILDNRSVSNPTSIYHPQHMDNDIQIQTRNEIARNINWTKLENYIEVNDGWNDFARFLNDSQSTKNIIPGFYAQPPERRITKDRPKAMRLQSAENAHRMYHICQKVDIEPFKIHDESGDISVLINNKHFGFVLKKNIHFPIKIGEYHIGFVHDINSNGKIECIFEKPNFWHRMNDCQHRIISILEYCNGSIRFNDKSASSEVIEGIFQMSKKNFKRAIGMLFKANVIGIDKSVDNAQIWLLPQYFMASKSVKRNEQKSGVLLYDVAQGIENRMWQSKPIWEYGHSAPSYGSSLPKEVRNRQKYIGSKYQTKYSLKKQHDK